jgi:ESCRT-I complex subunit TSG101
MLLRNRLVNLVAEDNAIEDTIYHLHRALNTGQVDLERFLRVCHDRHFPVLSIDCVLLLCIKMTRVLAEEQFMKRALIEKIQSGMPMGMSSSNWT